MDAGAEPVRREAAYAARISIFFFSIMITYSAVYSIQRNQDRQLRCEDRDRARRGTHFALSRSARSAAVSRPRGTPAAASLAPK